MSVMASIITAGVLLAWIVPLTIGIVLLRRKQRTGGVVLTILGGIWAIPSLVIGAGLLYFLHMRSLYSPRDFEAAQYQGKTTTLAWDYRGSAELGAKLSDEHFVTRFKTSNGVFTVPDMPLRLAYFIASATDSAGVPWQAQTSFSESKPLRPAEQVHAVQPGPPYKAQIVVQRQTEGKVLLSLKITDRENHSTTISPVGDRSNPPRFKAIDKSGKVVWNDEFAFG